MKTYVMEVVSQVLTVTANSEEEAEAKYDAFFWEDECPCGEGDCDCVNSSDEVYHNTEEIKEGEQNV
jgi:hypothetical protein